jgi:hypothetical protein
MLEESIFDTMTNEVFSIGQEGKFFFEFFFDDTTTYLYTMRHFLKIVMCKNRMVAGAKAGIQE